MPQTEILDLIQVTGVIGPASAHIGELSLKP